LEKAMQQREHDGKENRRPDQQTRGRAGEDSAVPFSQRRIIGAWQAQQEGRARPGVRLSP
jgi:hypothetical protein